MRGFGPVFEICPCMWPIEKALLFFPLRLLPEFVPLLALFVVILGYQLLNWEGGKFGAIGFNRSSQFLRDGGREGRKRPSDGGSISARPAGKPANY